ncbi:uncharacterized protein LOC130291241 isoform X3 [Hyla sarda]|uniref:uncharacterized protein LOC130291241 isoform X3 n=1 Tax=Hyla sarda TaxID=327740 RepID=UPI0024C3E87B|nr:uncharacterized protein LOC130291241 isoform X3 [Hyla sarda]
MYFTLCYYYCFTLLFTSPFIILHKQNRQRQTKPPEDQQSINSDVDTQNANLISPSRKKTRSVHEFHKPDHDRRLQT